MRIEYWPEYDALYIRLREDLAEVTGAEVAPGIVFHYSADGGSGEIVSIEMDSQASKLANLNALHVQGLEVSAETVKKAAG